MNLFKKSVLLSIALVGAPLNIECMDKTKAQKKGIYCDLKPIKLETARPNSPRVQTKNDTKKTKPSHQKGWLVPLLSFVEYLTEVASIYAIDSAEVKIVDNLAKARVFFNGLRINAILKHLLKVGLKINFSKDPILLHYAKVQAVFNIFVRSNNIFKDFGIWKKADLIASNNKERKDDKSLLNKKLYHYAWLTCNYLVPLIVKKIADKQSNMPYYSSSLTNLSELCRQQLMYALIENKQKMVKN